MVRSTEAAERVDGPSLTACNASHSAVFRVAARGDISGAVLVEGEEGRRS
jgi:hypothetical protein